MADGLNDAGYHRTRFRPDDNRETLWATLCTSHFQRLIAPDFHVLELGAGYANFINNIRCRTRTAVDLWPELPEHVNSDVTAHVGCVTDLAFLPDASVDFVFASNLFEHLTQAQFADVLAQLGRKVRSGATLNILQPNYQRAYKEYFDDYTHISVYSHVSLCDFLEAHGWKEYGSWHLAVTDGASDETKGRYAFVFGDFRRLHRMALIACYYRAAEWEHTEVMLAAHKLLVYLDTSRA